VRAQVLIEIAASRSYSANAICNSNYRIRQPLSTKTPATMTGTLNIPKPLAVSEQSGSTAFSTFFAIRSRSVSDGATDGGTPDLRAFKSRAASRAAFRRAAAGSNPSMNPGFRPDPSFAPASVVAVPPASAPGAPSPVRGPGKVTVAVDRPPPGVPAAPAAAGAFEEDEAALGAPDAAGVDGADGAAGFGVDCVNVGVAVGAATGAATGGATGAAGAGTAGAGVGTATDGAGAGAAGATGALFAGSTAAAALGGSAAAFTGSGGVGLSAAAFGASTGNAGGATGSTVSFFTGCGSGGTIDGVTGVGVAIGSGSGAGCGNATGDCFSTRAGGVISGGFCGVGGVIAGVNTGVAIGGRGSTSDGRSVTLGAVMVTAALVGGVVTGLRFGSVLRCAGVVGAARATFGVGSSVGVARAMRAFKSVVVVSVGARNPMLLPPNSIHINAACTINEIAIAQRNTRLVAADISWRTASRSVIAISIVSEVYSP
jgi:hypothetical protein